MKVTEVQVYQLSYQVKKPYANSRHYNRSRGATYVEVKTDSGLVGWGESSEPTAESFVKSPVGGGELARGERSRGFVGVVKAEEERVGVEAFEEFWIAQSVRRFGGI